MLGMASPRMDMAQPGPILLLFLFPCFKAPSAHTPNTDLAPDELSQADEDAPHPLVQLEWGAAEGLPAKLHDHYLQVRDREDRHGDGTKGWGATALPSPG